MRFGKWRGVAVVCALSAMLVLGRGESARAGGHILPREVPAVDLNTGGPYMAPPIPYGHYAKAGLLGKHCGLCGGLLCRLCGGAGCGACGGKGCGTCGGKHGLFGGKGCGDPGAGCGACGGSGCGFCSGKGLLHGLGSHGGGGVGVGDPVIAGSPMPVTAPSAYVPAPSAQVPAPSAQSFCGTDGCHLATRHAHRLGNGCNLCSGQGCGFCQGGGMVSGDLCGSCNGSGCGACGGRGLFGKHRGNGCGACGGKGCGLCGGGKGGCGACGGKGCGLCGGGHGLGLLRGLAAKALHKGEIKYFMGPGGPVPLTPGYVPYVVTTRSPRDFFAFPPFSDVLP